jgi:hypothetical protein
MRELKCLHETPFQINEMGYYPAFLSTYLCSYTIYCFRRSQLLSSSPFFQHAIK